MSEEGPLDAIEATWRSVRGSLLFRVTVLYAGSSWVALQAAAIFGVSPRGVRVLAVALGLLYLVVLVALAALVRRHRGEADASRGSALPRGWGLVAVVSVLALVGAGAWLARSRLFAESLAPGADTIAVLPFTTSGSGVEEYGTGMVDLLTPALDDVGEIRTVNARTVLHHWAQRVGDAPADLAGALDVGRAVGAGSVLLGSVSRLGSTLTLQAELYRTDSDGTLLARARADGDPDSVLALADELTVGLLREIWRSRRPLPSVSVSGITTTSIEAIRAFLEGEKHYRASRWEDAIEAFDRAVEADSTFALGYQRISQSYGWLHGLGSREALDAARLAQRWSKRLPERERSILNITLLHEESDFATLDSIASFAERYPDDPTGHYLLGEVRYHAQPVLQAPYETILDPFERAIRLDPSLSFALRHPMEVAVEIGDSAAFEEYWGAYRTLAPEDDVASWREAGDIRWAPAESLAPRVSRALREEAETPPPFVGGPVMAYAFLRVAHASTVDPEILVSLTDSLMTAFDLAGHDYDRTLVEINPLILLGRIRAAASRLDSLRSERPLLVAQGEVAYAVNDVYPDSNLRRSLAVLAEDPGYRSHVLRIWFALHRGDLNEARSLGPPPMESDTTRVGVAQRAEWDRTRAWMTLVAGDTLGFLEAFDAAIRKYGYLWPTADPLSTPWFVYARVQASRPETREEGIRRLLFFTRRNYISRTPLAFLAAGEALEKAGRNAEAAEAYGHVARLWRDADPYLQPAVESARQGIERLIGERGGG